MENLFSMQREVKQVVAEIGLQIIRVDPKCFTNI